MNTDARGPTFQIPPIVTDIGSRASMKGINLVRASCELVGALKAGESVPTINVSARIGGEKHKTDPQTLVCQFGLDLTACGPTPEQVVARFSFDYAVQYGFSDEAFFRGLRDPDIGLFAAYSTSIHVWPYAREFVQSMAFRMNLPSVLLPVFRPSQVVPPPEVWAKIQEGASPTA